jgi:two-component system NtrC family sensor kinase
MEYNSINMIVDEALLIVNNESKYFIDIEKDFDECPEVYSNRGQLGQVILNIVVNSIQAIKLENRTERGHIKIKTSSDEGFVTIGPGIAPEIIGKIFDPFFTTKDVGVGTGLGLSISHDIIVNKHKGNVFVNTIYPRGVSFKIVLPRQTPDM